MDPARRPAGPPSGGGCFVPDAGPVHAGPVRMFVAAWPPPGIVDRLRPVVVDLRGRPGSDASLLSWTAPERWHVTLAFLGDADPDVVSTSLTRAAGSSWWPAHAPVASIGPSTSMFAPSTLFLPVDGLAGLAAAVRGGLGTVVPYAGAVTRGGAAGVAGAAGPEAAVDGPHRSDQPDQPFVGHLTVARVRRRDRPDALGPLVGVPVPSGIAWAVTAASVVTTERSTGSSRYVIVGEIPVGGPADAPGGTGAGSAGGGPPTGGPGGHGPGGTGGPGCPPSNVCSGLE